MPVITQRIRPVLCSGSDGGFIWIFHEKCFTFHRAYAIITLFVAYHVDLGGIGDMDEKKDINVTLQMEQEGKSEIVISVFSIWSCLLYTSDAADEL